MKEYDIALIWNSREDCYFAKLIRDICRKKGRSFFWIDESNAKIALRNILSDKLHIMVLIDTDATYNEPDDIFAKVCYAAKDQGTAIVNDPDTTCIAIDKAIMYYRLLEHGIDVPYTKIIRSWQSKQFKLSKAQKEQIGAPFIIKPSQGYARRGLIRAATGSSYGIAKARAFDPDDHFLLQKKVKATYFDKKKGWFRAYRVFDTIIPCWWDDIKSTYEHISRHEFKKYKLKPLFDITTKIAQITDMLWFSTEIAVTKNRDGSKRYMSIDHVNDQCDMTPLSQAPDGIPEHIVKFTAKALVSNAIKLSKRKKPTTISKYCLYLRP